MATFVTSRTYYSTVVVESNDSIPWSTADDEQSTTAQYYDDSDSSQFIHSNYYNPSTPMPQRHYGPSSSSTSTAGVHYPPYLLPTPVQQRQPGGVQSHNRQQQQYGSHQLASFGPLDHDPNGAYYAQYAFGNGAEEAEYNDTSAQTSRFNQEPSQQYSVPSPPWMNAGAAPPPRQQLLSPPSANGWPRLSPIRMPPETNHSVEPLINDDWNRAAGSENSRFNLSAPVWTGHQPGEIEPNIVAGELATLRSFEPLSSSAEHAGARERTDTANNSNQINQNEQANDDIADGSLSTSPVRDVTDSEGISNSMYETVLKDELKTVSLQIFDKDVEISRLRWAIESLKQESHNSYAKVVCLLNRFATFFNRNNEQELALDTRPPWFDVKHSGAHKRKIRNNYRMKNDVVMEGSYQISKLFSFSDSSSDDDYDYDVNDLYNDSDADDEICVRPSQSIEDNTMQESSDEEEVCERFGVHTACNNHREEFIDNHTRPSAKIVEIERLTAVIFAKLEQPLVRNLSMNIDHYGPIKSICQSDSSVCSESEDAYSDSEFDEKKNLPAVAVFMDIYIQTGPHHGCDSCGRSFTSFDQVDAFSKSIQTIIEVSDAICETTSPKTRSLSLQTNLPHTCSRKIQTIIKKDIARGCQTYLITKCAMVQAELEPEAKDKNMMTVSTLTDNEKKEYRTRSIPCQTINIRLHDKMLQTEEIKELSSKYPRVVDVIHHYNNASRKMRIVHLSPRNRRGHFVCTELASPCVLYQRQHKNKSWLICRVVVCCLYVACSVYFDFFEINFWTTLPLLCTFLFSDVPFKHKAPAKLKNLLPAGLFVAHDMSSLCDVANKEQDQETANAAENNVKSDNGDNDVVRSMITDDKKKEKATVWGKVLKGTVGLVGTTYEQIKRMNNKVESWIFRLYYCERSKSITDRLPWCPYVSPDIGLLYGPQNREKQLRDFCKHRNIKLKIEKLNSGTKVHMKVFSYVMNWKLPTLTSNSEIATRMLKKLVVLMGIQGRPDNRFIMHPDNRYFIYWLAKARNEKIFTNPPKYTIESDESVGCEVELFWGDFSAVARGESGHASPSLVEKLEHTAAERLFHNVVLHWYTHHNAVKCSSL